MNKLMPVLLMLVLSLYPVRRAALAQQQSTDSSVGKIKTDVARRLRDAKTNVTIKLRNGSELKGRITKAAENIRPQTSLLESPVICSNSQGVER